MKATEGKDYKVIEVVTRQGEDYVHVEFFPGFLKSVHEDWKNQKRNVIVLVGEQRGYCNSIKQEFNGEEYPVLYTDGWKPRSQVLFPLFKEIAARYLGEKQMEECTCDFSKGNWACTCGYIEIERARKKIPPPKLVAEKPESNPLEDGVPW